MKKREALTNCSFSASRFLYRTGWDTVKSDTVDIFGWTATNRERGTEKEGDLYIFQNHKILSKPPTYTVFSSSSSLFPFTNSTVVVVAAVVVVDVVVVAKIP